MYSTWRALSTETLAGWVSPGGGAKCGVNKRVSITSNCVKDNQIQTIKSL